MPLDEDQADGYVNPPNPVLAYLSFLHELTFPFHTYLSSSIFDGPES
jgi:hypothetical protein